MESDKAEREAGQQEPGHDGFRHQKGRDGTEYIVVLYKFGAGDGKGQSIRLRLNQASERQGI